jgi:hypothetical protein
MLLVMPESGRQWAQIKVPGNEPTPAAKQESVGSAGMKPRGFETTTQSSPWPVTPTTQITKERPRVETIN